MKTTYLTTFAICNALSNVILSFIPLPTRAFCLSSKAFNVINNAIVGSRPATWRVVSTNPSSLALSSRTSSSDTVGDMYTADTTNLWNETLVNSNEMSIQYTTSNNTAMSTTTSPLVAKYTPKRLPFIAGIKYLWEVFRGTVHIYQYNLAKQHGDAYIIWNKYITLTNADAIRDILYVYNLEKPEDIKVGYKALFFPTGGILAAPWKEWIQQRRMTAPALSENVVGKMAPKFEQAAKPLFELLEQAAINQDVIEMDYVFSCLAMDTIGLILLGRTFGLLDKIRLKQGGAVPFQTALKVLAQYSMDEMVYGSIPKWMNRLLRRVPKKVKLAKQTLNEFLDDCINQRLSTGVDSQKDVNLLNIMLKAEDNGVITREEVKAQLLLFIFAGFETTAHTLSFLLYEVAVDQKLQNDLFYEVKNVLPNRTDFPKDPSILAEGLPLMDRVWLETLRLHPSTASGITRVVGDDPIIVGDGLELPAGTTVSMSTYAYHRNPKYWKNPEIFDPSRFEPDQMKKRDPITLLSFSAGPRNCVGSRLARAEALSVMSSLLRRYEVTCAETKEPATFQSLTTRPRDGIRFTFRRRGE